MMAPPIRPGPPRAASPFRVAGTYTPPAVLTLQKERQTLERGEGRIGILEPAVIPRR